jgi:acyl-CoA thioester hydrolase
MSPIPVYEHNVVVLPSDIDENQHANNVCYLLWMNAAALAHSAANGWLPQRYIELGSTWFARKHTIEYLAPCYEGEEITVETWIDDWQRIRSTRKYRFLRKKDGVTVAQAETLWAFVNLATGRPTRIPPIVTDSFTVYKTHPPEPQQS